MKWEPEWEYMWEEASGAVRTAASLDWLKTAMVAEVAAVHSALMKGNEDALLEGLSSLLITAYLTARRTGIPFTTVDEKAAESLAANVREGHELERWYGDLSALLEHFEKRKPARAGATQKAGGTKGDRVRT